MKNEHIALIAVITPTYNRLAYLKLLFESLLEQTSFNFEWWVLDDGSSDETGAWIKELNCSSFSIHYVYRTNGGKHRAINHAVRLVQNELVFIVDSDDVLTKDAIQSIDEDWELFGNIGIAGISYLRGTTEDTVLGDSFKIDLQLTTHEQSRILDNVQGDKAEIWKREELLAKPFLEFEGERFFSEQYCYLSISGPKKIITRNKIIYITEYLATGLSASQRCLQYRNPLGTLENSIITSKKDYGMKRRLKSYLMIVAFSIRGKRNIMKEAHRANYGMLWLPLVPIGLLVFIVFCVHYQIKCISN
jgi:glycosyltransferase involved in cell wall biosynthesis